MTEQEELVFLEPSEIPKSNRGGVGRDWSGLFDQIPKGKVLVMTEDKYGSSANIRAQVSNYNKTAKKKVLNATQRTDAKTEKTTVYVTRV